MENTNQHYDEYEIDLREYILLLWDNKLFITGLVIFGVLAAFIYSSNFIIPIYQNDAVVQLANSKGVYSETKAISQLLKSNELIKPALEKNNLSMNSITKLETEIISDLKLTENGMQGAVYGGIINITAEGSEQKELYKAMDAIISEFEMRSVQYFENIIEDKQNQLKVIDNSIENLNKEIAKTNEMLNRLEEITIENAFVISNINEKLNTLLMTKRDYLKDYQILKREIQDHREFRILNPPQKEGQKISPNTRLNIAIAAVLALMLAVFIIFFKEFMKEE